MTRRLITMVIATVLLIAAVPSPAASAGFQTCLVAPKTSVPESAPDATNGARAELVLPEPDGDDEDDDEKASSAELNVGGPVKCADPLAYPGPFDNPPETPTGRFGRPFNIVASTPPTTEADDPVVAEEPNPLAHSGTDSFVLAYFGTGLVAFGAVALGSRRRFVRDSDG